jgi:hypothetical protein
MAYNKIGDMFKWWVGQVEDLDDPDMLGRVRIRVFNEHDLGGDKIVKEDLLWAYPISPIQSASLNSSRLDKLTTDNVAADTGPGPGAVGWSPTGIEVGSYAFGFYFDGPEAQMPFIFGTYHKIFQEEDGDEFHDVSKLAREEQSLEKYQEPGGLALESRYPLKVAKLKETKDKNKNTKVEGEPHLLEPPSAYATKYPNNKTFTTKTGHAIEIDDTPDAERIHVFHKSGTYTEINFEGRRVTKVVGNDWEIVKNDKNVLVKGNLTIESDQNATVLVKENAHVYIGDNAVIAIDGNCTQTISKNVSQDIGGNVTQLVEGNLDQTVKGNMAVKVKKDYSLRVDGKINIHSDNETVITSPTSMDISGANALKLSSGNLLYFLSENALYEASVNKFETVSGNKVAWALSSTEVAFPGAGSSLVLTSGNVIATTKTLVNHIHKHGKPFTSPPIPGT